MVAFTISSLLTTALLAQAPAEGVAGWARAVGNEAFVNVGADPSVDQSTAARGEARLEVRDRVDDARAPSGDEARFSATVVMGVDRFTVELLSVGAPEGATPGDLGIAAPLQGGVRVGPVVFGATGLGPPGMAAARAAISVVGVGRVSQNGRVIAARTPLQVFALAAGIHADDDTARRLPLARWGDQELVVYLPRVQSDQLPGYLLAVFENPVIAVADSELPGVARIGVTESQRPTGGAVALGAGLPGLDAVTPPDFRGALGDLALTPPATLPAVPLPRTVDPANAAPAIPFPAPVGLPARAPLLDPTADPVTLPAVPLPAGIPPAGTTPLPGGAPPSPAPANAAPATPLPQGIPPANVVPFGAAPPAG
jgi:hypothetical protein